MFRLSSDKEIEICIEQMALDYNISEKTAKSIIYDLELEYIVKEFYKEVIDEVEKDERERLKREAEYDRKHYADGWSDHEEV